MTETDTTQLRHELRREAERALAFEKDAASKRLWLAIPALHLAVKLLDEMENHDRDEH